MPIVSRFGTNAPGIPLGQPGAKNLTGGIEYVERKNDCCEG